MIWVGNERTFIFGVRGREENSRGSLEYKKMDWRRENGWGQNNMGGKKENGWGGKWKNMVKVRGIDENV